MVEPKFEYVRPDPCVTMYYSLRLVTYYDLSFVVP